MECFGSSLNAVKAFFIPPEILPMACILTGPGLFFGCKGYIIIISTYNINRFCFFCFVPVT
ncbi:hypothetical protein CSTERLE_01105 [Thermoclostridium stercorarium subsp. leptospartum DSM 9219]|uniref:Uncharacterized protein n=1 Tax=Thermoclostridium stercorarium subsp. leptospartum DSM 9219 TaxID=1346611 RepID=A0A1B1YHN5_THEST|nr:hypothetical protein CSTERLE_01105 [Thermoclostridium stercorarium subsp. leptospartum DSM 9219]